METPHSAASEIAISALRERAPLAFDLAAQFKANGFRLALVGGPVRDALLNRLEMIWISQQMQSLKKPKRF